MHQRPSIVQGGAAAPRGAVRAMLGMAPPFPCIGRIMLGIATQIVGTMLGEGGGRGASNAALRP